VTLEPFNVKTLKIYVVLGLRRICTFSSNLCARARARARV
jgi:hypothetical protein